MSATQLRRLDGFCYARFLLAGGRDCTAFWTPYHKWLRRYRERAG